MQESLNTHFSDGILILDSDINVLNSLKSLLRKQNYRVYLISTEAEALELLRHEKIKLVISELHLNEGSGLDFFKKLMQIDKHPIRILFTSYADHALILDALFEGTIHHLTQKPWEEDSLLELINRSVKLYNDLNSSEIKNILTDSKELLMKANPKNNLEIKYQSLEDVSLYDIVEKIEKDPIVVSKVIQISNSVYYGLQKPVSSVNAAVQFLGVRYALSLLTLYQMAHTFLEHSDSFTKELIEKFILISVQRANLARKYCEKYSQHCAKNKESIFIAALLLDVGHLIKLWFEPEKYKRIFELIETEEIDFYQAEQKVFNLSHETAGAKVLEFWNFPQSIIEIVLNHHQTESLTDEVKLIQIVDRMVSRELSGPHFKNLEDELKEISF